MTEQQLPEEVLSQLIKTNNFEGIKKLFEEFGDLDPNFSISEQKPEQNETESPKKDSSNSDFYTPFTLAVKLQNHEVIKFLLDKGIAINLETAKGNTALHLAVINQDLTTIKLLCEDEDIEVDRRNEFGKTPIWLAIVQNNIQIAKFLSEKKEASFDFDITISDFYKHMNHIFPPNSSFLKEIPKGLESLPILFYSAVVGDLNMLDCLLSLGQSPFQFDQQSNSLLHHAAKHNQQQFLEFLIEKVKNPAESAANFLKSKSAPPAAAGKGGAAPPAKKPAAPTTTDNSAENQNNLALLFPSNYIESENSSGDSALMLALKENNLEITKWMIDNLSANLGHINSKTGFNLLTEAAFTANKEKFEAILNFIQNTFNNNSKDPKAKKPTEAVEQVEIPLTINTKDKIGNTPLHYIVCSGNLDLLNWYLNLCYKVQPNLVLDLNAQNFDGNYCFHLCCLQNSVPLLEALINQYIANETTNQKNAGKAPPAKGQPAAKTEVGMIRDVLFLKNLSGETLFHVSAKKGGPALFEFFLKKLQIPPFEGKEKDLGLEAFSELIDTEDCCGFTPLESAINALNQEFSVLLIQKSANFERYQKINTSKKTIPQNPSENSSSEQTATNTADLNKYSTNTPAKPGSAAGGAKPNASPSPLTTPAVKKPKKMENYEEIASKIGKHVTLFQQAVANCMTSVVKEMVVKNCIHLNTFDKLGNTPLHTAVLNQDLETVKVLCTHPALEIDKFDKTHKRSALALSCALQAHKITSYLILQAGADVTLQSEEDGKTALHFACASHSSSSSSLSLETVKLILEAWEEKNEEETGNSNLNFLNSKHCLDKKGRNPLFDACEHNNVSVLTFILEKILSSSETNANLKFFEEILNHKDTANGWTLLHISVFFNSQDCVSKLLEMGAKTNVKDHKNETAFSLSIKECKAECAKLIQNFNLKQQRK